MARQKLKARDKKVQKMKRDGLVEINKSSHTEKRVSSRASDTKLYRNRNPDGDEGDLNSDVEMKYEKYSEGRLKERGRNPDKPQENISKKRNSRQTVLNGVQEKEKGEETKARLQEEKKAELFESRGDSRKEDTGGTKRPQQKKRLQFVSEETGSSELTKKQEVPKLKNENQEQKKLVLLQEEKKHASTKEHSGKQKKFYQEGYEKTVRKKKSGLRFEKETPETGRKVKGYLTASALSQMAHDRLEASNEDENSAVEGALLTEEAAETVLRMNTARKRKAAGKSSSHQKAEEQRSRQFADHSARSENRRETSARNANSRQEQYLSQKAIQKKRIQKEYAKAHRTEEQVTTATRGTIEYIKKVGGKVTDFFKEHRKVYISIALMLAMILLFTLSLTSCSSMFLQNLAEYTGTGYISSDEAIYQADLYYSQLEANLQEEINEMRTSQSGYDDYRYNIGVIEHDPFVLISYLSAKYEDFTFEQVKDELDTLFALQYGLSTEGVRELVTETRTVRVGESLGQVVTSGYCNCVTCCGQWSGGPTASGAMPRANHTIAVDASDPFVPMGTRVVMNGVEYTVEDTGNFARYGVQFDVYYDSHSTALQHGHRTWEAYLADDNGSQEVEVTSTREVDILNVTLSSKSLYAVCMDRLGTFEKKLFEAYNETKGNLQMFESPFVFNWYSRVSSNFGYRIHPISGENQMHNGLDIGAPGGTVISAGLTGKVKESAYNDSYGNYVILENEHGYELRYAHMDSRSVSAGDMVTKGDEIGTVGNTGTSTGYHLHLELLKDGQRLNPIFYMETGTESIAGSSEYCSEAAARLLAEADRYLGVPYVWGGYSPSGFDCSGFVSYCLVNSGVRNTGRLTAQGLYNICTPVAEYDAQPGDLIFFTGTYNAGEPVTHIGIYVGNGQMIHCGHPVQYTSIYSPYWQGHFYGFGRW